MKSSVFFTLLVFPARLTDSGSSNENDKAVIIVCAKLSTHLFEF